MRTRLVAVVLAGVLLAASRAEAEGGAWIMFEYRQPIHVFERPMTRLSWRVNSETRFSNAGLAQQFLRTGPLLEIDKWFFIAVHGTVQGDRSRDGRFVQEYRLEVEPTFTGRLWRFTYSDRNRFEFRWREAGSLVRYRNQLRINYAPEGQRWVPFVWNEWLFDLRAGFNQNRFAVGLAWMIRPHVRIEAGYLLRSRREPTAEGGTTWEQDHIGVLSLFIGWPAGW